VPVAEAEAPGVVKADMEVVWALDRVLSLPEPVWVPDRVLSLPEEARRQWPPKGVRPIAAGRRDSVRRKAMPGQASKGIQACIIRVTGRGGGVLPITMAGGGTRTRGGKIITTEAPASISISVASRGGVTKLAIITSACAITVVIDGFIRVRDAPGA
jgi:hypothetical protein